jgi:hypothetical protein
MLCYVVGNLTYPDILKELSILIFRGEDLLTLEVVDTVFLRTTWFVKLPAAQVTSQEITVLSIIALETYDLNSY